MLYELIGPMGTVVQSGEIIADPRDGNDLIAAIQAEIEELRPFIENGTFSLKLSPL